MGTYMCHGVHGVHVFVYWLSYCCQQLPVSIVSIITVGASALGGALSPTAHTLRFTVISRALAMGGREREPTIFELTPSNPHGINPVRCDPDCVLPP
jgi:hypothetical protein